MSALGQPGGPEPQTAADRNPTFGIGALRRRICLQAADGAVHAGVEDQYHSFRLQLRHDGTHITHIEPRFLRVPLSTCPTAELPLREFVGLRLDTSWRDLVARLNPRAQCTHLFDLTVLAMAQALRGGERTYEVTVPDEHPDAVWSTVHRDGVLVLRWRTFKGTVLEPETLAGRPLLRGFSTWANVEFDADDLEAALVLHKGYFVSRARPWNVEAQAGRSVLHHTMMRGACHSYTEPQMSVAIRTGGTTVDTSDPATPLLIDMNPPASIGMQETR